MAENMRTEKPQDRKLCGVHGCSKPFYGRDMCHAHYERWRTGRQSTRPIGMSEAQLFVKNHVLSTTSDECILWPFAIGDRGYGIWSENRIAGLAHRIICKMAHGNPPSGQIAAAHSCGNKQCVNPRHLRWATYVENEKDKKIHGTDSYRKGEKSKTSKFNDAQIAEIRSLYPSVRQCEIAARFKISRSHTNRIVRGMTRGAPT